MAASTSTAANPTNNYYYYDVFINHRGPDVKKNFASHLYRRLLSHGLRAFLDQPELQPGDNFNSQIEGAIRTASVHVAIFSPRYAESKWCLDELLLMFKSGAPIIPVFYEVEPSELRWARVNGKLSWTRVKTGVYAQALQRLENKTTYDSQTQKEKPRYDSATIENWRDALSRVADISGLSLKAFNEDEGELLDKLVESVLKRVKKTQLNVAKYPTGLDEKVMDFETTVLLEQQRGKVQLVGITGLGGVGKTTLAKELFNRKSAFYSKTHFLSDVRENAKTSLHSLQRQLLKGLIQLDLTIDNSHQGIEMLQKHLSSSQVLLVLDDVDHVDQVDALLPVHVLHPHSLILITSRDKDVLTRSGIRESKIYKLTGLNSQHSTELFCSHAFCHPHPPSGFECLVQSFVKACNGLPLSLKVFGGLLYRNGDESYWESQLDKLQRILPSDIQKSLKISYDSLDRHEQQIFLDIASFFIGKNKDAAIRFWDGSGWSGSLGFQCLQNKCLVELDNLNLIRMHDHLRDLGREIVEVAGLPRFVSLGTEDIDDLLQQSSVIAEVRGIQMLASKDKDNDDELTSFSCNKRKKLQPHNMRKLQLLDGEDVHLARFLTKVHIPNLIWLRWEKCSYSSLPSWIPIKNLRVLEVQGNKLETLWQSESQVPLQLRQLKVGARLSEFPKCIGKLKYLELIYLYLKGENNVRSLPEELCNLRSLKTLVLRGWSKLKSLPDSFGNLTNLQRVDLSGSSELERLPNSFRNLIKLKDLNLYGCSNLTISSETLGNISTLENVNFGSTEKIEVLPPQIARQRFLEGLYLEGTHIKELPSAIGDLVHLEYLRLESPFLETLPPSLGDLKNLKQLLLRDCTALKCLPDSIGFLNQLTEMTIDDCPLCEVSFTKFGEERETVTELRGPGTLSNLDTSMVRLQYIELYNIKISEVSFDEDICPNLQRLHITRCNDLVNVGTLPNTVVQLDLYLCHNLRTVKGLCGLAKLQMLSIQSCKEVEELPSIETLVSLAELKLSGCVKLKSILGLVNLTKLQFLYVNKCSELEDLSGIEQCTSLEKLNASGCPKLQWGEGVLEQLSQRLKELQI